MLLGWYGEWYDKISQGESQYPRSTLDGVIYLNTFKILFTSVYFKSVIGIEEILRQAASVMCRFVAFSRLPANQMGRLIADKGVVFADSLIPAVFFREMKLKLPAGVPTQPLQSLQQVSAYLHKIHRLAFCTGTGLRDPIRSMKCCIYVDMPSSARRCTACSTQRQAVLFAAQQKTT